MTGRRRRAIAAVLVSCLAVGADARTQPPPVAPAIDEAFRAAYNLDEDQALALARRAVAMAPGDSAAHRALASILWLSMLFHRGTVTVDHFLSGLTRPNPHLPEAPPELQAEFKREVARAIELADARLRRNWRDVQARYDLGAAYALQASYVASIEGSPMSAFQHARRAYDAQEEVLARDPRRASAGLVVGTYRYMVSVMSWPSRVLAYVVGFGGGKERGIKMIEDATHGDETRVEAAVALLLVYTREGRHLDAMRVAADLARTCPGNRLFVLEEGAAAIRAGRGAEAEAILTSGLARFEADKRPKIPGERALWLYKRGMARVLQNRPADALVDLNTAAAARPLEWVRGRVRLELGKIADLAGRRTDAIGEYRQARVICQRASDLACAGAAGRLIGSRFTLAGR
jgi:tetratricopeptide (TPR) repeat protein